MASPRSALLRRPCPGCHGSTRGGWSHALTIACDAAASGRLRASPLETSFGPGPRTGRLTPIRSPFVHQDRITGGVSGPYPARHISVFVARCRVKAVRRRGRTLGRSVPAAGVPRGRKAEASDVPKESHNAGDLKPRREEAQKQSESDNQNHRGSTTQKTFTAGYKSQGTQGKRRPTNPKPETPKIKAQKARDTEKQLFTFEYYNSLFVLSHARKAYHSVTLAA